MAMPVMRLNEAHMPIDLIGGSSMGAIIGAKGSRRDQRAPAERICGFQSDQRLQIALPFLDQGYKSAKTTANS
jgi:predicted acylesterase/phospholipase RssA